MSERAQKLRITFVIPYFYPAWEYGGQPRSAYALARALVEGGHRVKVLTTDSGGRSRLNETGRHQVDGIEVIYYRNVSNQLAFRYRLFWPQQMLREIDSEIQGSDIVHIHELRSTTSVLAYGAARRAGIPYLLSGHGGLRRLGRTALKAIYDSIWGRRILRDAVSVIAISPSEISDAKWMGIRSDRIQLLPNIVRNEDFQTLPARGAFRRRWSIPDGPLVLFLGRLHRLKGADLLVEAFSRFAAHPSRPFLVIAGPDDGQERELRAAISKLKLESRMRLVGFLDLEAKKEAFVDASVLVIPSRSEVFAITAVEALMCGTPVLLSTSCGLEPLPEPKDSVTFFETEDVADLETKLRHIIEKHSTIVGAAKAAQRTVVRLFSSSGIASRAEAIYFSAATARRKG